MKLAKPVYYTMPQRLLLLPSELDSLFVASLKREMRVKGIRKFKNKIETSFER